MSDSDSTNEQTHPRFMCPVCGYDGLPRPAYYPDEWGSPSWDVCESCGTEFGYHDASGYDAARRAVKHEFLRQRWIAAGIPWHAQKWDVPPPPGWDPAAQLAALHAREGESGDWDVAKDEEG